MDKTSTFVYFAKYCQNTQNNALPVYKYFETLHSIINTTTKTNNKENNSLMKEEENLPTKFITSPSFSHSPFIPYLKKGSMLSI